MIEFEFRNTQLKVYENGDIELFRKGQWNRWVKAKDRLSYGYKIIEINNKEYKQHRIVYFAFHQDWDINNPKLQIDHINRVKNDNRLENLRVVTSQQNQFNRSNTKGYSFVKDKNKWRGFIMLNGKSISKYFDTEEEARAWYLEQKALLHLMP